MADYSIDLCEGGIATAIAGFDYRGTPEHAFDGIIDTHYLGDLQRGWLHTTTGTNWIQYQFTEAKKIEKVRILSYEHNGQESIKDFTIQASNTGVFGGEEVLLFTGQDPEKTIKDIYDPSHWYDCEFSNSNLYIYYRIVVTSHWPGNAGNNRHINEIEMMEKVQSGTPYIRPDNITGLYNISSSGILRGKASEGFIRPTIKQFFTSENFEEIVSQQPIKSVIIDVYNVYEVQAQVGLRSVEFFNDTTLIPLSTNFSAYAAGISQSEPYYYPKFVFETDLPKTGAGGYNSWATTSESQGIDRIIIVFDEITQFNRIVINNYHHNGGLVYLDTKDVKIYTSSDAITDTTPKAAISNSTLIFDGTIPQHVEQNVADDWEVPLI